MARKNRNATYGAGRRARIQLHRGRCGCRTCKTRRAIANGSFVAGLANGVSVAYPKGGR